MKEVLYVEIQKSHGFNMLTVKDFLHLSLAERAELVEQKKVQFLDEDGEILPLQVAAKSLGM